MSHIDPPSPSDSGEHDELDNLDVQHEHADVEVGPIVGFAISLLVVVAIVCVLMYGLQWTLERQAARNDPVMSPLARPPAQMPPTTADPYFGDAQGPRLITSEPAVLSKQRAMEAEALGTYGWVDEKAGVARIPIQEAKKLILQRGLPARADAGADPTQGTRRPTHGESSGGRTIPTPAGTMEGATQGPAAPAHPPKG